MRYNVGKFNKCLHLLKPSETVIDALGGVEDKNYEDVGKVMALQRDKSSTFRQVIGDYVTVNTCYFVIRDIRSAWPIRQDWRLRLNGQTYVINSITLLDDDKPYFLEIEATRLGGIG